MPTKRDNRDERLARLQALMEEYRTKSEDAREKILEIQRRTSGAARAAKASLRRARNRKKSL